MLPLRNGTIYPTYIFLYEKGLRAIDPLIPRAVSFSSGAPREVY